MQAVIALCKQSLEFTLAHYILPVRQASRSRQLPSPSHLAPMRPSRIQEVAAALITHFVLFADGTNNLNCLRQSCINEDCSAVRLTIHNPPVNLFDINLIASFDAYLNSLKNQTLTKVVVVSSDVPGFFGAHLDLNLLSNVARPNINASQYVDTYNSNLDLLLDLPVIFIGEIKGRTWGAGNENAVRYDMRFAGPDAVFGAPEAAGGLLHYGGAQQLVQLIGPGLAMEYLLGATEVNATEAERVGWVNSVYSTAEELRAHVDDVAKRIAGTHIEAIRAHKASVQEQAPSRDSRLRDLQRFAYLASQPYIQPDVAKILRFSHNQSRSFELDVNENIRMALNG